MLNRRSFAIGSAAMLAGCGDSGPKIPNIPGLPPIFQGSPAWTFHSNTTGATLQKTASGFQFAFPRSPSFVNLAMYNINRAISGDMVCTFMITGSNPVFNATLRDQMGTPSLRLWFQRKGDDWSAAIGNGSYRWWSNPEKRILAEDLGKVRGLQVTLLPDRWSNVAGKTGMEDQAGFLAAKQNCGAVGLAFGGDNTFSHGVNLLSGSAVFDMRQFSPA